MKLHCRIWTLTAAMLLSVAVVHAQDQREDPRTANPITPLPPISSSGGSDANAPPVPAARGVSSGIDESQPVDPGQLVPDTSTLSGAELFSVGSLGAAHNIFDPSLSATMLGQTGVMNLAGQQITTPVEIIGGRLNFNRTWDRYRLAAIYNGGADIYQSSVGGTTSFHDVALEQDIQWERWRLILRDDFLASPGAAFGGTGMGGPGLVAQYSSPLGSALNSLSQGFVPGETIQTELAMRYLNTALAEADYSFSRRSSFTFTGSYGLLRFPTAGFISSDSINAQAGYDYMLDPKDSIAVIGGYGKIDYTGTNISIVDYMGSFAFGRKITGRLAFQAAVGPEQIQVDQGVNGSFTTWDLTANSAITYNLRRTSYTASYVHGLANGSGVLLGAVADTFSGTVTHHFTRFLTGSVNAGIADNRTIAPSGGATSSFNTWFIGANIGRPIGHHALVNFNYGIVDQSNGATCPVTNCGVSGFQQTFGLSVNWRLRPIG